MEIFWPKSSLTCSRLIWHQKMLFLSVGEQEIKIAIGARVLGNDEIELNFYLPDVFSTSKALQTRT